jgi:hypothetical protein
MIDLPHPNGLSIAQYRARVAIARRIAAEGGCCSDLADELELTKAAVSLWFRRNPHLSELRDRLKSNARVGAELRGTESRRIALVVQATRREITFRDAAARLGITTTALYVWRRNNWTAVHDALHGRRAA